ncbi:MAG: hypothetical protein RBT46_00715 [Weeksellaceae bacterium]|nr:hypothetical protein [Weeksellaceae bacterium]MDX9704215.1 hypothetical protein [Weeksellaceae bacterium]
MKNNTILFLVSLVFLFLFTNCYVYRSYTEVSESEASSQNNKRNSSASTLSGRNAQDVGNEKKEMSPKERELNARKEKEERKREENPASRTSNPNLNLTSQEKEFSSQKDENHTTKNSNSANTENLSLKEILKPNKFYKIQVEEKRYKIQVDKWEGDTLVSHIIRRPNKKLRFHENQIDEESVLARKFSKPMTDIITVGSYVTAGTAILLLFL